MILILNIVSEEGDKMKDQHIYGIIYFVDIIKQHLHYHKRVLYRREGGG